MAYSAYHLGDEFLLVRRQRKIDRRWVLLCGLAYFPIAAILHHGVFFRSTCMLNPFGPDYSLDTLAHWLSNDPSPFVAAILVH